MFLIHYVTVDALLNMVGKNTQHTEQIVNRAYKTAI
jgi:hypothetical protein